MSNRLNFYLVLKVEEGGGEDRKLLLLSLDIDEPLAQYYRDYLWTSVNIAPDDYKEVTQKKASYIVSIAKEHLKLAEDSLTDKMEALKTFPNISKEIWEEYLDDFKTSKTYIKELSETIFKLEFLVRLVENIKHSDFEKTIVNIE